MPQRLSDYLKKEYGEKVYRLSLSSGCTCPNRDGNICYSKTSDSYYFGVPAAGDDRLTGGCSFCSEGGSGEFAAGSTLPDIDVQIKEAKALICKKTCARKFIAYFQSYTNTYGDVSRLKKLYLEAITRDEIVALSIGTRPDCIGNDILEMLKELNAIKPVWIELGLQTIHEKTAKRVNRGYALSTFENTYKRLKDAGIIVIVHVILGLPGESKKDMLETIQYLSSLDPVLDGIKLQNLQILKGTRMYEEFLRETSVENANNSDLNSIEASDRKTSTKEPDFHIMSMEEYTDLVAECIALLPKETVVHRMTGDGPRRLLVAPLWSLDKKRVLNMLTQKTGKLFSYHTPHTHSPRG